ncbi:YegP family protein [Haliea sp. E17]|uniref:YegP family protein n=1 Tax=Haliea sp. E17 TaxID=3401576 RepID=UPI003AAC4788
MPGYFEIKAAKGGKFFFNLVATNGQTILTSQMYKSKKTAKSGIASVQNNCKDAERYESKKSSNGKAYFVLKAKNHQVIGKSEMYESDAACKGGIKSVKNNGATTKLKDETAS